MGKFYIAVNSSRVDKLLNFDQFTKIVYDSILFLLAFRGDGSPGLGTVFDVSFLNVGSRIYSSSETFNVFGGDVDESSTISKRFVIKAIEDFEFLESQVFELNVEGKNVLETLKYQAGYLLLENHDLLFSLNDLNTHIKKTG